MFPNQVPLCLLSQLTHTEMPTELSTRPSAEWLRAENQGRAVRPGLGKDHLSPLGARL